MTETQTNHRAPLTPGEIRIHWIGDTSYQVMHVAGGSFTQASVREHGQPSRVLKTDTSAAVAVRAYADAIEQAESDRIDALDDADGPSYDASGAYLDGEALGEMLPTPEPGSLAALIDAYGEAMSKGATCLVLGRTAELVEYAGRADALKAEILARFGGGR
jgi:hypothetical protein